MGKNEAAPSAEPLVEVMRGSLVESVHRGHAVAVDGAGDVVVQVGSPDAVTFMRSAAKPHQALPLILTGAAGHFSLSEREIAVACGSHNGEAEHTETVLSILRKAGLGASDLRCGAHEPYGKTAAARLRERGERPGALHNNCSGKHAGMLALAKHLGARTETYDRAGHPAQQACLRAVAQFSGVRTEEIATATDGCGVPTFALSVRSLALMYARLVAPPEGWGEETRRACLRVVSAMLTHPEMVEGEGELDTELMRHAGGRLVSKVGAEGVYAAGVLPCGEWPRGLGLALKIEDGDRGARARPPAAVELLRQLGALRGELKALEGFAAPPVYNRRGERVGEVRASFRPRRTVEGDA